MVFYILSERLLGRKEIILDKNSRQVLPVKTTTSYSESLSQNEKRVNRTIVF